MNFPNGSILDVGCGEGTLSDYVTEQQRPKYLGIDISKEAVHHGRAKRPGIKFKATNAETFVPRHNFDAIVFNEVLYYMNHRNTLMHYSKFLNPGGILVISVFYRSNIQLFMKSIFNEAAALGFKSLGAIQVTGQTPKRENPGQTWEVSFHIEAFRPI
jgi:2-polyprenyl-3-methyl-5-hydroxy-6-metoxy-1,4-benzoquinol methylase